MRKVTIVLIITVLSSLLWLLPAQAGTITAQPRGISSAPIVPAQVAVDQGYLEGVASMYDQVQAAPNTQTNRAFKDVLDQLFQPNAVQMPFRFVTTNGTQRSVNYSGNVYFSQGQLFIKYDQTQDDEAFATIDGKLYTWKIGAKEGEILKRFKGDTLAFVMYMADPSAIMRAIYRQFLEQPKQFTTTTNNGIQTIQFKQVKDGFKGIQAVAKPFWLKTLLLETKEGAAVVQGQLEIDPPIGLEALPEGLAVLPKGVKFKASENDLRQRMTYL